MFIGIIKKLSTLLGHNQVVKEEGGILSRCMVTEWWGRGREKVGLSESGGLASRLPDLVLGVCGRQQLVNMTGELLA